VPNLGVPEALNRGIIGFHEGFCSFGRPKEPKIPDLYS
jgi:hypothetical protein